MQYLPTTIRKIERGQVDNLMTTFLIKLPAISDLRLGSHLCRSLELDCQKFVAQRNRPVSTEESPRCFGRVRVERSVRLSSGKYT